MAIAVDASSPVRWSGASASNSAITSASFTAPADAFLVACVVLDGDTTYDPFTYTAKFSDSGGLTWTLQVLRDNMETTEGGGSAIYTARTVSSVARTASFNPTWFANTGTSLQKSVKLYVLTGVDVDGTPVDTVGANNEGGSTTNSINTTSITPGANGLLIVNDCDWSSSGAYQSSSDLTQDTADFADISACSGYKTCTSGVGVTGNLNAAGTGAVQHKWCQITVREAAGGGGGTTPKNVFGKMLSGPFGGAI
jgi:hypothetical protein